MEADVVYGQYGGGVKGRSLFRSRLELEEEREKTSFMGSRRGMADYWIQ